MLVTTMMSMRRTHIVAAVAAAALSLAAPTAGPAVAGVKKGDRAAEFVQVLDAAGKPVSLRSLVDSIVVVTFGASWCGPCKKELPALEKLAQRYQQRRARVVFLAVNVDSDLGKGKKFIQNA